MCTRTHENRRGSKRQIGAAALTVKWVSLWLSVAILALALTHLGSLLRAFRRRSALLAVVRSGRDLTGAEFYLWCVLFAFGEAPVDDGGTLVPPSHYERDLRVWKLSGLVSAYLLGLAVNLGLAVGVCKRMEALFVPWIVVNLVAVLAMISLSMGIAIVHLVRQFKYYVFY